MAAEVYKTSFNINGYYNATSIMNYLAESFSASSHFNIIDSYTTHQWINKAYDGPPPEGRPEAFYGGVRYKGDPITGSSFRSTGTFNIWDDANDVGGDSWIVVECLSHRHPELGLPNWQAKFQVSNNGTYIHDPSDTSGAKYRKYHNIRRMMVVRFAPWGGWDLENSTPDFNPTVQLPVGVLPSTENHGAYTGNADQHAYLVIDDGCISYCCTDKNINYQFAGLVFTMGDVDPVSNEHMPMPRALLSGDQYKSVFSINAYWLEDNGFTTSYYESITGYNGMAFYDNELNLVERGFRIPSYYRFFGKSGYAQPNPYSSKIELFPYIPMPYNAEKYWFTVPMLRVGFGIGTSLVDDRRWLSTVNHKMCVYLKWDGSSDFL